MLIETTDRSDERMVQKMLEQEDLEKQMKRHPLSQLPGNIGSSNAHTKSAGTLIHTAVVAHTHANTTVAGSSWPFSVTEGA
jgi:hypothetical protein